eukprot:m.259125 g.259125  ORF g.259125 m.259125 type:complete len:631 (-) comp34017_c0_seq1:207-2099(-)
MVGQLPVVHDLQQDVVDIRVGLFDLVKQQHAMRMLVDAIGQKPALIEADIARRRTDQARDRVFLHVFRHVEAQQFHTQRVRQLFRHLGLADAGRTGEQVVADRLFGLAQTGPGQLDGRAELFDGRILTEDHAFERRFQIAQHLGVVLGHAFRRDAGDLGDHGLDFLGRHGFPALGGCQKMLRRARFVDHVDRLVGQLAVVDIARGQFDRGADRIIGVAQVVVLFEIGLQTHQDLHRVLDRRFVHVDLLEPAAERAVLFEVLTELLVGGRAHAAQLAALQRGFQQVRGIHRPARGRAGADHGVDLVDEKDGVLMLFKLFHHGFQPLFEIAAIAGPRQQRAHVERIDGRAGQDVGGFAVDDLLGQTFGDRRLAHAGITHQKRVVLAPAAEHLDAAFDLGRAADQRIDIALAGLGVQIDAELGQRRILGIGLGLLRLALTFLGARDGARFGEAGILGHAMGDEVDRVVAGHVLLLQEIGGVRFALGKDRHQHVGAGNFVAARALNMDRRALDHALEGGGGHRFGAFDIGDQRGKVVIDEIVERLAQLVDIDVTGLHDAGGFGFVDQREQQMLERGKLVPAGIGQGQRAVDRLFEGRGKRGHGLAPSACAACEPQGRIGGGMPAGSGPPQGGSM